MDKYETNIARLEEIKGKFEVALELANIKNNVKLMADNTISVRVFK